MRLGVFTFPARLDSFVADVKRFAEMGFPEIWVPQIFGPDALIAIAVAGREVPGVRFGTGVVPTYPRHPMAFAQQALTANEATGGRLSLGIGLSHKVVIEGMYGMSFDRPAVHMREYLSILMPLVRGEKVNVSGDTLTARGEISVPGGGKDMPVLIAAMAPRMLELAGAVADGTVLWMTGPNTTKNVVRPTMLAAAEKAGRGVPTTVAGLPICLTSDVDGMRARAAKEYVIYGQLPSYRAMLDHEGYRGPEDLAVIGDRDTIRRSLDAMRDSGVDLLIAQAFGSSADQAATNEFLAELARGS